jgi:hypothetical protein
MADDEQTKKDRDAIIRQLIEKARTLAAMRSLIILDPLRIDLAGEGPRYTAFNVEQPGRYELKDLPPKT